MIVPVFSLNLNHKILPHRVTIGKYDGVHPCLTAATTANKIFVHNPHSRSQHSGGRWVSSSSATGISLLNINQAISSLTAGLIKPESKEETLIVGSATNLLAYDIENNADLFYREVGDGANCVTVGHLGTIKKPLALVGGNCSLQGFDHEGNDSFWTVTGDNVSAMTLCDVNEDDQNELVVGSEDFDIRVFREGEIISEMTETEAVTGLCPVIGNFFGYALANGTVGVYQHRDRIWRIKSKNQAISIFNFDMDGDGVPELITGWSNGKIDARSVETGEVVFKDNFTHCIAGIVKGDYRLDGEEELIFCAVDGEVRGYVPVSPELRHHVMDANFEEETVRELSQKKQTLLLELRNYEENVKISSSDIKPTARLPEDENYGFIPADTQLKTGLAINVGGSNISPHVEIALQTTNDTIIRAVLIFAEGIFEGESHVIHPKESQQNSKLSIPLLPPKDIPVDLHIRALVGYKGSKHFHVFELTRQLPRFSMYSLCTNPSPEKAKSSVTFTVNERIQRLVMWINQNFLLADDQEVPPSALDITFISLRNSKPLTIEMEKNGTITIRTDNLELAGDIVQSLANFLNLDNLHSVAEFPYETENLKNLLSKVDEQQSTRQRLSANMADNSGAIRGLVVRAEDSRLMGDYKAMRQWYHELQGLNKELINEYKIRCTKHEELMATLKQVNQIIQKAGRLRIGRAKTQMISGCRAAIKQHNAVALAKIIQMGEA